MQPCREFSKAGDREIEVLEEAEEKKVDSDGDNQEEFATARIGGAEHAKTCKVADRGRESHESAELVVPGAIKNVAGNREPNVAVFFCAETPETEIDNRQEQKKKDEAVEEHVLVSALTSSGRRAERAAKGTGGDDDKRIGIDLLKD